MFVEGGKKEYRRGRERKGGKKRKRERERRKEREKKGERGKLGSFFPRSLAFRRGQKAKPFYVTWVTRESQN